MRVLKLIPIILLAVITFSACAPASDVFPEIWTEEGEGLAVAGDYETKAIGSERQLFIDGSNVDPTRTTAILTPHEASRRDIVMEMDQPWSGDYVWYPSIVEFNGKYMMYYSTANYNTDDTDQHHIRICLAESTDGINWTFPNIGKYEVAGTYDNNVVLEPNEGDFFDNFTVFIDTNPECPPEQRFKAIGQVRLPTFGLGGWYSADGYEWTYGGVVFRGDAYDTLNVCFWNEDKQSYSLYVRDMFASFFKVIHYGEKKSFWSYDKGSTPLLYTDDSSERHHYTNNIYKYYRAPDFYIGNPTLYNIYFISWGDNYKPFVAKQSIPVTSNTLMVSTDGLTFTHYPGNFARLTPQTSKYWTKSWCYGSGYMAYGMVETETGIKGQDNVLSFYSREHRFENEHSCYMVRYALRLDGFVSYRANEDVKRVVTTPVTFTGDSLKANFATSALGYVRVRILDENYAPIEGFDSGELYGDRADREILFSGDLSSLEGKTVNLEFTLCESDIYSYIFE